MGYRVQVYRPLVQSDLAGDGPSHELRSTEIIHSRGITAYGHEVLVEEQEFEENPLNDPENMVWISNHLAHYNVYITKLV